MSGRRTQVEAIDALTEQIRVANLIAVLGMPATAVEHDARKYSNPETQARADKRNELKAVARAGIEALL